MLHLSAIRRALPLLFALDQFGYEDEDDDEEEDVEGVSQSS